VHLKDLLCVQGVDAVGVPFVVIFLRQGRSVMLNQST